MKGQNLRPKAESGEGVLGRGQRASSPPAKVSVQPDSGWNPDRKCILDPVRAQKTV